MVWEGGDGKGLEGLRKGRGARDDASVRVRATRHPRTWTPKRAAQMDARRFQSLICGKWIASARNKISNVSLLWDSSWPRAHPFPRRPTRVENGPIEVQILASTYMDARCSGTRGQDAGVRISYIGEWV